MFCFYPFAEKKGLNFRKSILYSSLNFPNSVSVLLAYLAVAEYNIVLVDYGGLAADYHTIVANKHEIGQYIATFIMFLEEQQLGDRSSIHIIGFSAGGQVMSFVNDLLAHPKVGRMTGT